MMLYYLNSPGQLGRIDKQGTFGRSEGIHNTQVLLYFNNQWPMFLAGLELEVS